MNRKVHCHNDWRVLVGKLRCHDVRTVLGWRLDMRRRFERLANRVLESDMEGHRTRRRGWQEPGDCGNSNQETTDAHQATILAARAGKVNHGQTTVADQPIKAPPRTSQLE